MSLVYSARAVDEFAFGDELEALRQAGRLALHCTVTRDDAPAWPGRTGRVDDRCWRQRAGRRRVGLVCGPGPFVNDVAAALRLGVDPARVVVERHDGGGLGPGLGPIEPTADCVRRAS